MGNIRYFDRLHIGATMDVAYRGGMLYAVQSGAYPQLNPSHRGRLVVVDVTDRRRPRVRGTLEGLGSARQIELYKDIAYITSREDGLYAVDISDPDSPVLRSRYDTAEYATGLAVANDLLVVSLRQYGLELIDASDPARLRFISLIRTGEAQSLCMDGHHVYAGVWGSKELVIADIADPARPRIVARAPLDGRGDGVAVRDGICYAATGQHARPPEGIQNPDPALYERLGNGLELFDVRDPARPVRLCGVKFPPYYGLTFDMWDVQLAGDKALVSDSRNGIYLVDVAEPLSPALLASARLPQLDGDTHEPITGFAFDGDMLYLAGGGEDTYLYTSDWRLDAPEPPRTSVGPGRESMPFYLNAGESAAPPYRRALETENVRFVDVDGDRLYAACSQSGVLILQRQSLRVIDRLETGGFAHTVRKRGEHLFVAACHAGLLIYREQAGACVLVARHDAQGLSVMDLLLSEDGRYVILQCASLGIEVLNVENPEAPKAIGSALSFVGLFYGRHFPSRADGHRFFFGVNRDGLFSVEPDNGGVRVCQLPYAGGNPSFGPEAGMELVGNALLLLREDKACVLLAGREEGNPAAAIREIDGLPGVMGKPRVADGLLVATERARGLISFAEITASGAVRVLCTLRTSGSPDLACIMEDYVYVPAGRQGLLVFSR